MTTDIAALRALLQRKPFTRLVVDYVREEAAENFEPGWRIHDFPEDSHIAEFLVDGLTKDQAKVIADGFNALPALLDRVEALEAGLVPFAKIAPSSLYAPDGSEAEGYCILLAPQQGNPVEFTGADLAAARALLGQADGGAVG